MRLLGLLDNPFLPRPTTTMRAFARLCRRLHENNLEVQEALTRPGSDLSAGKVPQELQASCARAASNPSGLELAEHSDETCPFVQLILARQRLVWDHDLEPVVSVVDGEGFGADLSVRARQGRLDEAVDVEGRHFDEGVLVDLVLDFGWKMEEEKS